MNTKSLLGLNRKYFFERYARGVGNWKHKLRGLDGKNEPIRFTTEDKALIREGLDRLFKDLNKRVQ